MPITLKDLLKDMDQITTTVKVCVPSRDFYRSRGDWSEEDLTIIDPILLVQWLKTKEEGK